MLIFQVLYDFDSIVFEVEVGMQYRKIWHIYQKGLFSDKLLVRIGGDVMSRFVAIKDKRVFTTTGRRFIGIFNINGFEYLSYQILKEYDNKYIESVAFDIQKEMRYRNIIILVNDTNRIDLNYFAFGNNQILVVEDNEANREKLKYLHSVRWKELVDKCYKGVYLSKYNFCEYSNNKDIFINTFYFIDTEKIAKFKYFMNESPFKRSDIICNSELEMILRKELPNANYCIVDLEKYIDREQRYYYC